MVWMGFLWILNMVCFAVAYNLNKPTSVFYLKQNYFIGYHDEKLQNNVVIINIQNLLKILLMLFL